MSTKTKIVVLHLKELLYTGIFLALGVLFIVLLVIMFLPGEKSSERNNQTSNRYTPGTYTTSIQLGDHCVGIDVVVDAQQIQSVQLKPLDEAITTLYPLIEPSFEAIENQLSDGQSLEGISYSKENRYTSMLLIDAISQSLEKASVQTAEQ